jgi:pimeloyl-ACP methyl ester carboxylesterase
VVLAAAPAGTADGPRTTWLSMQRELAARLPGSRFVVAEGSGHDLQFDRPDLVVESVREVVERARAEPP